MGRENEIREYNENETEKLSKSLIPGETDRNRFESNDEEQVYNHIYEI